MPLVGSISYRIFLAIQADPLAVLQKEDELREKEGREGSCFVSVSRQEEGGGSRKTKLTRLSQIKNTCSYSYNQRQYTQLDWQPFHFSIFLLVKAT